MRQGSKGEQQASLLLVSRSFGSKSRRCFSSSTSQVAKCDEGAAENQSCATVSLLCGHSLRSPVLHCGPAILRCCQKICVCVFFVCDELLMPPFLSRSISHPSSQDQEVWEAEKKRCALFEQVKGELQDNSRTFWESREGQRIIKRGLSWCGNWERQLASLRQLLAKDAVTSPLQVLLLPLPHPDPNRSLSFFCHYYDGRPCSRWLIWAGVVLGFIHLCHGVVALGTDARCSGATATTYCSPAHLVWCVG